MSNTGTKGTVLFSFPGISITPPHTPSSTAGFLVLTSSKQPSDFDPSRSDVYLRLQHTPENTALSSPIDFLVEAWRELRKISPREFILGTEFGDLGIAFPDLHRTIPLDDARIDLPTEVKQGMKWEDIVREFETEVDRFVSYSKNTYSLISSPFGGGNIAGNYTGNSSKSAEASSYSSPTSIKQYDPSSYPDEKNSSPRVVLVDEENGSEVGEVGGYHVKSIGVVPGSKNPVEITFSEAGQEAVVTVRPADYLADASDPAYKNSKLVQTASTVSRLVVATSVYVSNTIQTGARTFNEKTQPNAKPLTFQPATHQRFQKVHTLTSTAAKFSSTTLGKVQTLAQNAGAKIAGNDNEKGRPRNPGILNKSMIAFCTVADGIDYATKSLLTSSAQATTSVVNHRYGPEAGNVAKALTGTFKNVGLVYIDASGVSRRAVVKGVAKGMVVGRVKGGGEVMVPPTHIDGLPPGWGDGPLGGPNAGPPSNRSAPSASSSASPPPYSSSASYSDSVAGTTNTTSTYYPQSSSSPAPYKPSPPRKGEYRF